MYQFTQEEALLEIKEELENGYDGYLCDINTTVFNNDYFIYYSDAKESLEEYGVFNAIGDIVKYEKENFGEIYTDLSNPCDVANALRYIKGYEAMLELINSNKLFQNNYVERVNEEIKDLLIKEIDEWLQL